ncbi:MAG: hypothetical protein KKH34_06495 [Candidatus Omnitrophica bacterium]|nr:hypothetical protein [Candidatus Omnitrophota bacterium]
MFNKDYPEENELKQKILAIFSMLGGINIQKIRFKEAEKSIANIERFDEKEALLCKSLHDLKNNLIGMLGFTMKFDKEQRKSMDLKKLSEPVFNIQKGFGDLHFEVIAKEHRVNIGDTFYNTGIFNRVLDVISEVVPVIRSCDRNGIKPIFDTLFAELKAEMEKDEKGQLIASQEQKDFLNFLNSFSSVADYQVRLFSRQKVLSELYLQINEYWGEIGSYIEALKQREDTPEEIKQSLLKSYEKAKSLYEQFNIILKSSNLEDFLRSFVVLEIVLTNDYLTELAKDLPGNVTVSYDFTKDLPKIKIDRKIISSTFSESAVNAVKYGGKQFELKAYLDKGFPEFVRLDIRSEGQGIAPENREKVFEGLRETAGDDRGTGIGMGFRRQTLEWIGARIWVSDSRSAPRDKDGVVRNGGFAVFSILLPIAEDSDSDESARSGPRLENILYPRNSKVIEQAV